MPRALTPILGAQFTWVMGPDSTTGTLKNSVRRLLRLRRRQASRSAAKAPLVRDKVNGQNLLPTAASTDDTKKAKTGLANTGHFDKLRLYAASTSSLYVDGGRVSALA